MNIRIIGRVTFTDAAGIWQDALLLSRFLKAEIPFSLYNVTPNVEVIIDIIDGGDFCDEGDPKLKFEVLDYDYVVEEGDSKPDRHLIAENMHNNFYLVQHFWKMKELFKI